jgi:hypothetical protein
MIARLRRLHFWTFATLALFLGALFVASIRARTEWPSEPRLPSGAVQFPDAEGSPR